VEQTGAARAAGAGTRRHRCPAARALARTARPDPHACPGHRKGPDVAGGPRCARAAAANPPRRWATHLAGGGPYTRTSHAIRSRTAYRSLLRPRSTRGFQRRHRSHGPHLQAGKPAAPASACGSGTSGGPQQSRCRPSQFLFSVDRKKKERCRGHHRGGAQTRAAALPHAQRRHRLHRVPPPRS